MQSDVVRREGLDAEPVLVLDLDPVDADVLFAEVVRVVRVPADDGGLVDVGADVVAVEPEQRQQLEQVDAAPPAAALPRRCPQRR
jgi:hypothetical protein